MSATAVKFDMPYAINLSDGYCKSQSRMNHSQVRHKKLGLFM